MTAFVTKVIVVTFLPSASVVAVRTFVTTVAALHYHAYQCLLVGVVRQTHRKCFSLQPFCVFFQYNVKMMQCTAVSVVRQA
jgi:hypothetical protein